MATAVGGNSELVTDGHNGLLVLPENVESISDGMLELARDKNSRLQMGEKSRAIIEGKFAEKQMIERYAALYSGQ